MLIVEIGKPKTGKTVSACTFPKKMLFLDWDGGFKSVQHTRDKAGQLVVPDWKDINIISFLREGRAPLEFKTATKADFENNVTPEYAKKAIPLVKRYNDVLDELHADQCVPASYIKGCSPDDSTRIGPFDSLVLDSCTAIFRVWKEMIITVNKIPHLRIADYGTLEGILFSQFIPDLITLSEKIPWIILIVHEDIEKDELTGKTLEFPIGTSRAQGKLLSSAFDETWRQVNDGNDYVWRTKNHGRFESAGSRLDLPDRIKANYQTLKAELDKKK